MKNPSVWLLKVLLWPLCLLALPFVLLARLLGWQPVPLAPKPGAHTYWEA